MGPTSRGHRAAAVGHHRAAGRRVIPLFDGLRTLAGDALVALGTAVRNRRGDFNERVAAQYLAGRMECEGPDAADTAPLNVNQLDALEDSTLLRMAAHVIEGWKPLLIKTAQDVDSLDDFIHILRDRATQHEVVERDLNEPFLGQLDDVALAALRFAAETFPQSRRK